MDKIIIPSENIQGDITSCKIENQLIRVDRKSAYSLSEVETYSSYDVCSKQIIETYQVPTFTVFSFILLFCIFVVIFVVIFIIGFFVSSSDY